MRILSSSFSRSTTEPLNAEKDVKRNSRPRRIGWKGNLCESEGYFISEYED
jgi:hypothetical protein